MQQVDQLERQLQQFIQKHGTGMAADDSSDKASSLSRDASQHVGGEFVAVHQNEMLDLARETKDDFQEMQELLKTMESKIPQTLQKSPGNPAADRRQPDLMADRIQSDDLQLRLPDRSLYGQSFLPCRHRHCGR
ncbi:hypothetical protein VQ056_22320 [Paenibacillus sp. JTLBN-2024]